MHLIEMIRAIEDKHAAARESAAVSDTHAPPRLFPTGWAAVDSVLGGGLLMGSLHEWYGVACAKGSSKSTTGSAPMPERNPSGSWSPPVGVIVHLTWQILEVERLPGWVVWLGRRCFPYPAVLVRQEGEDRRLMERSLFVSAPNAFDRLWAIDLALRSEAVAVVIAEGLGFDMAATRRVQLLAKRSGRCAFFVRPPWERDELSAAQTRWLVQRAPSAADRSTGGVNPRWSVRLLRCKGLALGQGPDTWALEWNRAKGAVDLSAPLVGETCAPQAAKRGKVLAG